MAWTTFTRRTNDPKLRYLERRLDALGIPHRRNGESFHAPILEVPGEHIDRAWRLLNEAHDDGRRLDDIDDDDQIFNED